MEYQIITRLQRPEEIQIPTPQWPLPPERNTLWRPGVSRISSPSFLQVSDKHKRSKSKRSSSSRKSINRSLLRMLCKFFCHHMQGYELRFLTNITRWCSWVRTTVCSNIMHANEFCAVIYIIRRQRTWPKTMCRLCAITFVA